MSIKILVFSFSFLLNTTLLAQIKKISKREIIKTIFSDSILPEEDSYKLYKTRSFLTTGDMYWAGIEKEGDSVFYASYVEQIFSYKEKNTNKLVAIISTYRCSKREDGSFSIPSFTRSVGCRLDIINYKYINQQWKPISIVYDWNAHRPGSQETPKFQLKKYKNVYCLYISVDDHHNGYGSWKTKTYYKIGRLMKKFEEIYILEYDEDNDSYDGEVSKYYDIRD